MKSLLFAVAILVLINVSAAQEVYIANEPQMKLMTLDFATGAQTTLYNIGARPDDLVVNSLGQLIYSVPALGTVNLYNPITGANTVLASGLKYARDLLIEPGGATMLISVCPRGQIMRFNFATSALTVLSNGLGSVNGLAYDSSGHLFAVANSNTVVQIDPATGAVLKTLVLEAHSGTNGGDGMTYDPFSGQLWVSHYGTTGGLIEIPTDLSRFTLYQEGKLPSPDGIKSDGKGNLFIGAGWRTDMYNIPSDSIVKSYIVRGADGISLVPQAGSGGGGGGGGSVQTKVYIANEPQMKLMTLDFATGAQTTIYNIGAEPDDLTINSQGQLIYSVPSLGTINLFDPVTGENTVLVSGLKYARDLLIEPGGATMLIANYAHGQIVRFNFSSGALTLVANNLGLVDGMAYDPAGHLFAVANSNTVVQINPATGAFVKVLVLEPHSGPNGGDGMTYDSFTGQLWVSHYGATNGLIEIPTDLSGFTLFQTGNIPFADGIKSDGKGNLFIGAAWRADMYNIPTDTIVKSYIVRGADGIAIVPN